MAVASLKADGRTPARKSGARVLRRTGRVPAVLYGIGVEPVSLSLDGVDVDVMFREHGTSSIIVDLEIGGDKSGQNKALVKEVQRDTVTGEVLHMDLQRVSPTRKLIVDVPVVVVGEAKGVKEGGVMEVILRDLQVQCLPADIPDKLEIDISEMDIGDSVHIRDLSVPNAEIQNDPDNVVLSLVPPTVYEEVVPEAEVEEEAEEAKEEEEAGAEPEEKEGERKESKE